MKAALNPDRPLDFWVSQNQGFVGRVSTQHVGLKPDLRSNGQPGLKPGWFRIGLVVLTLAASSAAFASGNPLGTVFYSPAERAAIVATRSGQEADMDEVTSYYILSGFIKREGDKSVAWINGKPVTEKSQTEGAPPIRVTRDGVLIDGKPAKVGERLDATSGERSSALPPDAVKVNK